MSRSALQTADLLRAAVARQARALAQVERARCAIRLHSEIAAESYAEAQQFAQELTDALALNVSNREWVRMQSAPLPLTGEQVVDRFNAALLRGEVPA